MEHELHLAGKQRAEEFLNLYASCERGLYAYIITLIGNPTDARDILQDTALILWQKFDDFDRRKPFFAWAHEFARYRTLRYRQIRANDLPALTPEALDAIATRMADRDDSRDRLYAEALPKCVEELKDTDRELIQLRYGTGTAVKVLSQKLNRSVNAVSQSLARVRRRLRECVEETVRRQENQGA